MALSPVIIPVPHNPSDLTIPHPVYNSEPTVLKAVARNVDAGIVYSWTWDSNVDGNFDNDPFNLATGDETGQIRNLSTTVTLPSFSQDRLLSVGVKLERQDTGEAVYSTYPVYVYASPPPDDPRDWSAEQLAILRSVAIDDALWYLHTSLVPSGANTSTISGYVPGPDNNAYDPTPSAMLAFSSSGHLSAYPPGTFNNYGLPMPPGWTAGNDQRWNNDPYAEDVLRMFNWTVSRLSPIKVEAPAEENDGRTPIPGTDDFWGVFASNTQIGEAGAVGYTGAALHAFSGLLPVLGGTPVQVNGPLQCRTVEYVVQQMVDYMVNAQLADGGWSSNLVAGQADGSTSQWAFIGLEAADRAMGSHGVIVNNLVKGRLANLIFDSQTADGGAKLFGADTAGSFTPTAAMIDASAWLGIDRFDVTDTELAFPGYSDYTRGQLRQTYDGYLNYLDTHWTAPGQRDTRGWADGLWESGDYLQGSTSGLYNQGRGGNTYAIYSTQKGLRTLTPDPNLGQHDWRREMSVYYVRGQYRSPQLPHGMFLDDFNGATTPILNNDLAGLWNTSLAVQVLSAAGNQAPVANAGGPYDAAIVGGTPQPITLDGSGSNDPNAPADSIVSYEWDTDYADGTFTTDRTGPIVNDFTDPTWFAGETRKIAVRVTDSFGVTNITDTVIHVASDEPPALTFVSPVAGDAFSGQSMDITFDISDPEGDLIDVTLYIGTTDANKTVIAPAQRVDTPNDGSATRVTITYSDPTSKTAGNSYWIQVLATNDALFPAAGSTSFLSGLFTIDRAPLAQAGGPYASDQGAPVTLDGAASSDPDAGDRIVAYDWDVDNDGQFDDASGTSPTVPWTTITTLGLAYPADPLTGLPANTIRLRVTDEFGLTNTATTTLRIYDNRPIPVIVATPDTAPIVVTTGDATVDLDATGSSHGSPDRTIVRYEWDLDGDGGYDDATGPDLANQVFHFDTVPAAPVDKPIALRVTDDIGQSAVGTATLHFQPPPTPPTADAAGPYVIEQGEGVTFDGSGSFDPDESLHQDFIRRVEWDLDDDGTFDYTFNDGTDPQNPATQTLPLSPAELQSFGLDQLETPYTIRLRVTDSVGLTGTDTTTLTIYTNQPVARIVLNPNPAAPTQPITFDGGTSSIDNPAHSITRYEWDFDYDGGSFDVDATGGTTTHSYPLFGSYTAALRVTADNGRTDVNTTRIDVNQGNRAPVAALLTSVSGYVGMPLRLDGSASTEPDAAYGDRIVEYAWDLDGDGNYEAASPAATDDLPWATVEPRAAYPTDPRTLTPNTTLLLRVTDTFGRTNTVTAPLYIFGTEPVAVATPDADTVGQNQPVDFSANQSYHQDPQRRIVSYEWDFDYSAASGFVSDATGANVTHAYPLLGNHTTALRVTDDNVPAKTAITTVVTTVVNARPVANAGGPYTVSEGSPIQFDGSGTKDDEPLSGLIFEWDLDFDGVTFAPDIAGVQPLVTFPDDFAPRAIALRVTDSGGEQDTAPTTLTVTNVAPTLVLGPLVPGDLRPSVGDPDGSVIVGPVYEFVKEGLELLNQHERAEWGDNWCGPTAAGTSLGWFAEHGYPALVPDTNGNGQVDESEKYEVIDELGGLMGTDPDAGTTDKGFVDGLRDFLDLSGLGGSFNVKVFDADLDTTDPTFADYSKELQDGEDVLVGLEWRNADGSLGGHWLTARSVSDSHNANGNHDVSFVDPWTGTVYDTEMKDDGSVLYDGSWRTFDIMVSVSPIEEGSPLVLNSLFALDAGVGDVLSGTVNWGDGTGTEALGLVSLRPGVWRIEGGHTYAQDGPYTVSLTIRDDDGGETTQSRSVQVLNVAINPVVQLPGGRGTNSAVVSRNGDNIQVLNNKKLLFNEPEGSFQALTILGAANKSDTLTVDFSVGGPFVIPDGIVFDAGPGKIPDTLVLRGTAGADTFTLADFSVLVGNDPPLRIEIGGTERVILNGGTGDDTYRVSNLSTKVTIVDGKGNDVLDFSAATVGVNVNLTPSSPQRIFAPTSTNSLVLKGVFENVIGSPQADIIRGNSAANRIEGAAGNDTLYGNAGDDWLYGGPGDDWLYGGAGGDNLFGQSGNNVLVGGTGNDVLDANVGVASGMEGRNLLIGGTGADTLQGGPGEEILIGGRTTYDNKPAALAAVMEVWQSPELPFEGRWRKLDEGFKDTAGWVQLRRKDKTNRKGTVLNDGVRDSLFGADGSDWFFDFANDATDRPTGEP